MIASKIENIDSAELRVYNFGIKEVMVASNIKTLAAAAAEIWILDFGSKEVLVVKSLHFADWPFPESAAAKSKNTKYHFTDWALL